MELRDFELKRCGPSVEQRGSVWNCGVLYSLVQIIMMHDIEIFNKLNVS